MGHTLPQSGTVDQVRPINVETGKTSELQCSQETDCAEGCPTTPQSLPGPGLHPSLPDGGAEAADLSSLPASPLRLSQSPPRLRLPGRRSLQAGQQRRAGAGQTSDGAGGAEAQLQGESQLPRPLQQPRPHPGHDQHRPAGPVRFMSYLSVNIVINNQ